MRKIWEKWKKKKRDREEVQKDMQAIKFILYCCLTRNKWIHKLTKTLQCLIITTISKVQRE